LGNPVELMLTPGQAQGARPGALLGDKACDGGALIGTLTQRGITPVIPPKANRECRGPAISRSTANETSSSCFFNKLKHFRVIATRYDKLAKIFLAGVQLKTVGMRQKCCRYPTATGGCAQEGSLLRK
jgi:transposase